MIDFQVIGSRRANRGLVVLDVNVGGQNQSWTYKGIRAGVIWQPIPDYNPSPTM